MSPSHCDSPLVLTFKSSKVKRKTSTVRGKKPFLSASTRVESGWLGKKARDKSLATTRKTYSGEIKTPLSTTRSLSGWLGRETANKTYDSNEDVWVKSGWLDSSDGDFECLRDSPRPKKKNFAAFSKIPRSPSISEFYSEFQSEVQATNAMRRIITRSSSDSSGPVMSVESASSMLTSPTTVITGKTCQGVDGVSTDTPKSGWKGKRQEVGDFISPKSKDTSVKCSATSQYDPDEIIEVDDEDTPPVAVSRSLRSGTVLTDSSKLCEFPMGSKDSVSVCLADYKTLEHDTFLNDIIIDFYLTFLYHKFLNEEDRSKVHIFSTMFYKRLNSTPTKERTVASYEKDSSLKPAEKRHMRVKGWTKNMNLFEKNMVIIPICEESHWYLVIAIRPGLITIPVGSEDRVEKGEPFMIVLDSMGGNKASAVSIIRNYLAAEWKAKMFGEEQFEFTSKELRTVRPLKPEQKNYTDCGIYLLHYIEKMFDSVAQYYWPGQILDLSNWFTTQEISTKRDEIARLIRDLSEDQNPGKKMKFPHIPFLPTAPSTRSKSRKKEYEHQSSDTEEDDFNAGETLDSTGLAAAGFYGERSGQSRNLYKFSGSGSEVASGESDGSTCHSTKRAKEQTNRNKAFKIKAKVQGSTIAEESGLDVGAKSFLTCTSSADSDISRQKLKDKMKQIKSANDIFDEVRKSIIPKTSKFVKDARPVDRVENTASEVSRPSSKSVIGVDNMPVSSQLAKLRTSTIPTERSSKKVENKNKSAALKAFHADQKAKQESIVKVTRNGCPDLDGSKRSYKSFTFPVTKKPNSSSEKGKVLQSKVLKDDTELQEEKNTDGEDEGGDVEVVNHVKVRRIAEEMESGIITREVNCTKAKEAIINIVTEKVEISRNGNKGVSKITELENISLSENTSEITTVEDIPDTSIISPGEDGSRDSSEITIEYTAPNTVAAIEYDLPLEGLLEEVADSVPLAPSSSSIEETVVSRKSTNQSDRISTSDSEAQKSKVASVVDVVFKENKSAPTFEPVSDPPKLCKTTPYVSTGLSRVTIKGRHIGLPKLNHMSTCVASARHSSEPVPPVVFHKSNGFQHKSIGEEANQDTSVKSIQTLVNSNVNSSSEQSSSMSESRRFESTPKPDSLNPLEFMSPLKSHSSGMKATAEPRSTKVAQVKTILEPVSPIISKNEKPPKIVVDSDSEDRGNLPGSELSIPNPIETRRTSQRAREGRNFGNLSEIEVPQSQFENIPTHERMDILAGIGLTHEVKITKASARNKLLRENPFYESFTVSRGTKSTQQQRGRSARNNSGCSGPRDIDTADQLHADTARHEVPIQSDLQDHNEDVTTRKRLRNLSPNALKLKACKNIVNSLSQFADKRFASDSGSDT